MTTAGYILIISLIFIVAVVMTMVGKGGGNFYVLILVLAHFPIQNAASTGQFILFTASLAALLIFNKKGTIVWPFAILVGGLMAIAAFFGGLLSHGFDAYILKLVFAILLLASGALMLIKFKEKNNLVNKNPGTWTFTSRGVKYSINLLVAVPIILVTGFGSGMVGVSGGSFLVPLMVLACGLPMKHAVGTASSLIMATAFMGFMGHFFSGDANFALAIPLSVATIIGGVLGSRFALKSRPKNLKQIFAYTNFLAAVIMIINMLSS